MRTGTISIHSSHTGRDLACAPPARWPPEFQSTLPIREETEATAGMAREPAISIHSSHTGRDGVRSAASAYYQHFNPLFPYGKRPQNQINRRVSTIFQSTLPIREETTDSNGNQVTSAISIHSSHTGRDERGCSPPWSRRNFNPLFPYGKRPQF